MKNLGSVPIFPKLRRRYPKDQGYDLTFRAGKTRISFYKSGKMAGQRGGKADRLCEACSPE